LEYEVSAGGRLWHVAVRRTNGVFLVAVDGREWTVDAARVDRHTLSLLIAGPAPSSSGRLASHEITTAADPASGGLSVHVGAIPVAASFGGRRGGRGGPAADASSGPQRLAAPMPGKIVKVLVKQGEAVSARQPLVVIEAMKMENELRAASDGRVAEIHVRDGQSVEAGALLAVIHR
jgi:biotin carboxyl carrier protein